MKVMKVTQSTSPSLYSNGGAEEEEAKGVQISVMLSFDPTKWVRHEYMSWDVGLSFSLCTVTRGEVVLKGIPCPGIPSIFSCI